MLADSLPVLMLGTLALLLFSGYPIGLVLGGIGLIFGFVGYALGAFHLVQFYVIVPRIWGSTADNLLLVAVPMFIFMGTMLERTGVAEDLLHCLQIVLRRLPGGLALSVVGLGTILAAMTGIVGASVVLIALLALPTLLEQRYSPRLAAGVVAASGTLGILIPPSIMLVVMADMLGASVGQLFLGAVAPGLVLAALYFGYVVVVSAVRPAMAPALAADVGPPTAGALVVLVVRSLIPPVILIALVLGSIFAGFATVTEASGVGAFGATVLALIKRRLDHRTLADVLDRATRTVGMVFLIILGATTFSFVFRALGGDGVIRDAIAQLDVGPYGVLLTLMATIFLLGFFFDWIEVVLIVLPVFVPVVAGLDFGEAFAGPREATVWFGILVALNLQTSFLTPPFGFALFYLKGVTGSQVRLEDVYLGIIPFVLLQILAVGLVMGFPELALWLPRAVLG